MLPTQSSGPGAFARFDLSRVPSPSFVVDEEKIRSNLKILTEIGKLSGAKVLLALKSFSMWSLASLIEEYLDGCCASGLWEARLAREKAFTGIKKQKILSTFCPAFRSTELEEICELSDHLVFNHPKASGVEHAASQQVSLGLRINPEISLGLDPKYDPCANNQGLAGQLANLASQILAPLKACIFILFASRTLHLFFKLGKKSRMHLGSTLKKFSWINLGGGHHCTRSDYDQDGLIELIDEISQKYDCQVYLEPGEAVTLDAGILVGEVIDLMNSNAMHALLDLSATCHAPDVIEAPYRPALLGDIEDGQHPYLLGGASCLTADSFGEYRMNNPLRIGDRVAFLDQAHYTMVKTNTFNGVKLPAIAIWNSQTDNLSMVREFEYEEFVNRLS